MFAPWIEDDPKILNQSLETDAENWKIHKLVKDEDDYNSLVGAMKANFVYLKDVYVNL